MNRFYCPQAEFKDSFLILNDPSEIHHLRCVVRKRAGELIRIFNGRGQEAEARIVKVTDAAIHLHITQILDKPSWAAHLTLGCAIPKKAKFEFIIEKATELGVTEIIPLQTERTEVVIPLSKVEHKLKRFITVAINAAKQSQRSQVPLIHPPQPFPKALGLMDPQGVGLMPHLGSDRQSLLAVLNQIPLRKKIYVFIGPEGDFTPREIQLARQAGCLPVSLGETVLKVDTAAIATIAAVQFFLSPHQH